MELKIYDGEKTGIGQGHLTAEKLTTQIDNSKGESLTVKINSGGGSVFDGWATYNSLHTKGLTDTVETVVDGLAASIACIILQAGTIRRMHRNSLLMLHLPTSNASGTADEIETSSKAVKLIENQIIDMLTKKTGLATNVISEMLSKETWMNADMALQLGFIDEIIEDKTSKVLYANMVNMTENAPIEIRQFVNSVYKQENNSDMETKDLIEKNTSVLTEVLNWFKGFKPVNEAKKKMYCKNDVAEGEQAFSDESFENALEDGEYEMEDSIVTVQNGVVTAVNASNKKTMEAENKIDLTETVNKLVAETEELKGLNEKAASLITDLKNQLEVSQAEVTKTREDLETEIRESIKSEFEPQNSTRFGKVGDAKKVVFEPKSELAQHALRVSKADVK